MAFLVLLVLLMKVLMMIVRTSFRSSVSGFGWGGFRGWFAQANGTK